jgi:hypothetical protein
MIFDDRKNILREIEAANRRREVTPRPACSAQS